jgi:hypothetical protein
MHPSFEHSRSRPACPLSPVRQAAAGLPPTWTYGPMSHMAFSLPARTSVLAPPRRHRRRCLKPCPTKGLIGSKNGEGLFSAPFPLPPSKSKQFSDGLLRPLKPSICAVNRFDWELHNDGGTRFRCSGASSTPRSRRCHSSNNGFANNQKPKRSSRKEAATAHPRSISGPSPRCLAMHFSAACRRVWIGGCVRKTATRRSLLRSLGGAKQTRNDLKDRVNSTVLLVPADPR